jgi:hypothetical protein
MTSDLVFALEAVKYSARQVLGVIRTETKEKELLKLLNKQMIFQVLGDPACLEELTTTEIAELEGVLILHS